MKTSFWVMLVLSVAIPFLGGCNSSDDNVQTVILMADDNGRAITLPNGALLEVILKGNPTTGFQWQTVAINPAILQYQKTEYNPDSSQIGAGGTYVLSYLGVAAGSTPLTLNYSDTSNNVAQTFQVTVTVKN